MKIVEFKDVTRTYVTGEHVQNALSNVDLELEDGTPFTLYDWKEGDWVDEDTTLYFHIGSQTRLGSRMALEALKEHGLKGFTPADAEDAVAQMKKMLGF